MTTPTTVDSLAATTWTSRCAARIRAVDCTASELEADALARALWETPGSRSGSPEEAADKVCAKSCAAPW
jgi:hypothetical protein